MEPKPIDHRGWTIVELLTAIVLAALVLLGITRVFTTTLSHYSEQSLLSDMHQNTQYALRFLTDMLMQAGADLPDSGISVVEQTTVGSDQVDVLVNPAGGVQFFQRQYPTSRSIAVDDGRGFVRRDTRTLKIVKKPYDRRRAVELTEIEHSYSIGNYSDGVDTTNDSVRVAAPLSFERSDGLYAYVTDSYRLQDNRLYRNDDVVAENIDSVSIEFVDTSGTGTTAWDAMRGVNLCVQGRTSMPIAGYTDPDRGDSFRRLTLRMNFRLRNKL